LIERAAHQLSGELPPQDGRRGLVLSASKEIEPGARAMLLLAESLFRLDVVLRDDTIGIIVRNLSSGELEIRSSLGDYEGGSIAVTDVDAYRPGRSSVAFALGRGEDRVTVTVQLGTLRFAERGTMQVTGQAIVREAPAR
jgi:hypothetical protein